MLGEGKLDFHTKMAASGPHLHEVACQLAWSAQPTLTIMILLAIEEYTKQSKKMGLKNSVVCILSISGP